MDDSLPYFLNNAGNLPYLRDLVKRKDTYVEKISDTMHIALLPSALGKLKTGVQDILNSKLRKYDPQLDGILVGYDNLALVGNTGQMIPGYAHIHVNIKADFYVFNPKVGGTLSGTVVKKSGASVTCLTNKVFTVFVSFPPHLKSSIQLHQEISFTIDKVDLFSQIPFVKGSLDENSVSSSSHSRFDDTGSSRPEQDSGLSSIGDDASTGRSPDAAATNGLVSPPPEADEVDGGDTTPRKSKKKKKRRDDPESGSMEAEASPRKSKKRRHDDSEAESSPRKSKKRRRADAAGDSSPLRGSDVITVKQEPDEMYLPDLATPVSIKKEKRSVAELDSGEEFQTPQSLPGSSESSGKKKKRKSTRQEVDSVDRELYLPDPQPSSDSAKKKKKRKREGEMAHNGMADLS